MRIGHGVMTVFLVLPAAALAQDFQTGQVVYAAPTGGSSVWYAGCVVRDGRSNNSFRVECAGTTWWVDATRISSSPPQPQPDPMRPGQMLVPKVIASTASASPPSPATPTASMPRASAAAMRATSTSTVAEGRGNDAAPRAASTAPVAEGPGNYAAATARRIAEDRVAAENAVLRPGKYSCYSMGQYTFSDLIINGAHRYTVEPGGSGNFNYDKGVLTFLSGPYAGAYSRMVDGRTVGVSAKGNTNLGTQCELVN